MEPKKQTVTDRLTAYSNEYANEIAKLDIANLEYDITMLEAKLEQAKACIGQKHLEISKIKTKLRLQEKYGLNEREGEQ